MTTPSEQPSVPPQIACPWCPYAHAVLAHVLRPMEARHPKAWREVALHPPIAGGVH